MSARTAFAAAKDKPRSVIHMLGNGFFAREQKTPGGDTAWSVHCMRSHEPRPHVLGNAIGFDISGNSVMGSWLPEGMDVIARLRRITCCKPEDAIAFTPL